MKRDNIVREKSLAFAVRAVNLYKVLTGERGERVMSKQLLRSGTSVGANVREALNAESTADFTHKLAIAQKECDETLYWLVPHRIHHLHRARLDGRRGNRTAQNHPQHNPNNEVKFIIHNS